MFINNSALVRCVFAFIMSFSIWAQAQNNTKIHITVMSYNIKNAYGGSTLEQIADVINDEDLDYVALQEVDSVTSRVNWLNEPRELGNLTNMYWDFAKGINFGGGSYGNSMLSKLPILKTVKVPLPGAEARSALLTDIDLSNGANPDNATVTFISTHWMNGDSQSQLESAIIINAYIDSIIKADIVSENWPFILLGDLNARNGSNPINEMKNHWKTSNFNYGIDWLFFRPANRWKWISSKKLPDPKKNLSDHEAVVSYLELSGVNLEKTFDFLENVLSEIINLFPSEYIHIGIDEVPKSHWKECSKCQARIEKEGPKDEIE